MMDFNRLYHEGHITDRELDTLENAKNLRNELMHITKYPKDKILDVEKINIKLKAIIQNLMDKIDYKKLEDPLKFSLKDLYDN